MASAVQDRTLRAVNHRLRNTPISQLPRILGHMTSQLVSAQSDVSTSNSEATHLKTRITSLLQDRTAEGKLCGVVLAKTVLDLGGSTLVIEDKDRISTWTRSLLDVLKRPGLATTKTCALVTIIKTFVLTWEHATLVRELTTPTLPVFITTCLQQAQLQGELVEFVLEAFATLLPRHPTVFRSFTGQIRGLALATLCSDPFAHSAGVVVGDEAKDAACHVLVLLHQTAQKGGGAAEWTNGMSALIAGAHASLDQVFRAVSEDWQSVAGVRSTLSSSEDLSDKPGMAVNETTGFPGWSGLQSGLSRIDSLLRLMQAYLATPTSTSIKLPLGRIVDLLTRLLYVQAPRSKDPDTRFNAQISRDEREDLLASLPSLHISTISTVHTLLERLDKFSLPICAHFIDLLTWLFQTESFDTGVRTGTYSCIAQLLSISGPNLGKSTVKSLHRIIQICCRDLLPPREITKASETINSSMSNGNNPNKNSASLRDVLTSEASPVSTMPGLHRAAYSLLPILYAKLPSHLIPKAVRTRMDRTTILTSHIDALSASVLNPAPGKASLLPFLSGMAPASAVTEAILRPRMPVILSGKAGDNDILELEAEQEEEMAEDESEDEEVAEEIDDVEMEQPKATDWAAITAQKSEAEQPKHSFGELSAVIPQSLDQPLLESQASKRPVLDIGEPFSIDGKRQRIDAGDDIRPASLPQVKIVDEPQVLSHAIPVVQEGRMEGEDSDDDGSDFEIPPLVMKMDFSDQEDEEDQ